RDTTPKSDYRRLMDVLQGMGIRAGLSFIEENHVDRWRTPDEAAENQKWMFFGTTSEEDEKIRLYFERNLIHKDGMFQLSYGRTCRWAVMWWDVCCPLERT
ncbi:MAG: hypothetical protein FWF13_00620, partial [Acidobacteria bacterium]|nr:hypothetical protein [Acidobacteriota bacterium]